MFHIFHTCCFTSWQCGLYVQFLRLPCLQLWVFKQQGCAFTRSELMIRYIPYVSSALRLWRRPRTSMPSASPLPYLTLAPLSVPPVYAPLSSCPFSEPRMHQNAGFCIINIIFPQLPRREGRPLPHPFLCPSAQSRCPSASFRLATALHKAVCYYYHHH